jgi:hypothetical protein
MAAILPTPFEPPWSYDLSDVLKKPAGPLSFDDWVKRVRRFRRDSVVDMGARLLWFTWHNEDELKAKSGGELSLGDRILRANAPHKLSAFRGLQSRMTEVQATWRHHAPVLQLLRRVPLIELDEDMLTNAVFYAACPWTMFNFLGRGLWHLVPDFVDLHKADAIGGHDVYSLRGLVFEDYLEDTLPASSIVKRTVRPANTKRKSVDFDWPGARWRILFEAKNRVRPRPEIITGPSLIAAWQRAEEAIDQAVEYLADHPSSHGAKALLVVVTAESFVEDSLYFLAAAKRWNWLAGTGLAGLALMGPAEFEHCTQHMTADAVGDEWSEVWSQLDPSSLDQDFRPPQMYSRISATPRPEHLRRAWAEAFPRWPDPVL